MRPVDQSNVIAGYFVPPEEDTEENIEEDIEENIEEDIEVNIEEDIEENIEEDIEENIEIWKPAIPFDNEEGFHVKHHTWDDQPDLWPAMIAPDLVREDPEFGDRTVQDLQDWMQFPDDSENTRHVNHDYAL